MGSQYAGVQHTLDSHRRLHFGSLSRALKSNITVEDFKQIWMVSVQLLECAVGSGDQCTALGLGTSVQLLGLGTSVQLLGTGTTLIGLGTRVLLPTISLT